MPDASIVLSAVLLALVPSLAYLAVLNLIDRYEKEPWTILLACVGVGAVAAPAIVLAIFAVLGRPATLPPAFAPGLRPDAVTGIVEELVLGLLLIGLVRSVRDEFDDILDGVIYGAAIGAGFGAAESFLYALGGTQLLSRGTVTTLVVAGLDHACYMAVLGAILGWVPRLRPTHRWIATALGLATAAWLHALHDTLPAILARILGRPDAAAGFASRLLAEAVDWLGLLTIAVVVVGAWRREARILRHELRDEVASGVVSEDDFATITSFRRQLARQVNLLRTAGLGEVLRLRRRYAVEGELAFHKWRLVVRHRKPPASDGADALRTEIRRLAETPRGGAA
jgi:RsiW-degrading membrane proteinase PrsW (M82 family)